MIWAFLSRRFRLWLMFTVGVPLLAKLFRRLGDTVEQRSGETSVSRGLKSGGDVLSKFERKTRRQDRRARQEMQRA